MAFYSHNLKGETLLIVEHSPSPSVAGQPALTIWALASSDNPTSEYE